jgi:hypothetical protein
MTCAEDPSRCRSNNLPDVVFERSSQVSPCQLPGLYPHVIGEQANTETCLVFCIRNVIPSVPGDQYKQLLKLLISDHHDRLTTKLLLPQLRDHTENMATSETVTLNEAHAPLQASIDAFNTILPSLKDELAKLRRDHDSMSLFPPPHPPPAIPTIPIHLTRLKNTNPNISLACPLSPTPISHPSRRPTSYPFASPTAPMAYIYSARCACPLSRMRISM